MSRNTGPVRSMLMTLSALAVILTVAGGCLPEPGDRQTQLEAVARWQDQRLAPLDSLVSMLTADDAHVRLAAVTAAGLIGRDDILPQLQDALGDPSVTVRAEAVWSLGLLGNAEAVPVLEAATADPRPAIRKAALEALGQLRNQGQALMQVAVLGEPDEAALAWNSLRNMVGEADSQALAAAIQAGLTRPEADVRWRVLRCGELAADSTLVPMVVPFARAPEVQVRVGAYRCLARMQDVAALEAVLDGFQSHDRFRGRQLARVQIAGCRALGSLGGLAVAGQDDRNPGRIAALLITAAGNDNPHVAETALAAMARMVDDAPLPAEAADQESLLPVWRIRMARAARSHLGEPHPAVRAAALGALGAVRGAGAAGDLEAALLVEESPQVLAAGLRAISGYHPDPLPMLVHYAEIDFPIDFGETAPAVLRNALVRAAAYEGLAFILRDRPELVPDPAAGAGLESHLYAGLDDDDFVIAATCAELVGSFPGVGALRAEIRLWDRAAGPYRSDMRLGVLTGLAKMLDGETVTWEVPDSLVIAAAGLLRESFDSPDIRIRTSGRQTAWDTGLLPGRLIPSEASLKATLPAVVRSPEQPPVALPFDAPKVRCLTPRGEFIITLNGQVAPNTCAVFLDLISRGFYRDLTYHRVVPDFVVQGGDPRGDGWGGPGYMIRSEWSRLPFRRATVGIAHSGKDTGGSQFFVTLSDQPHLNGRYTVFGEVTQGMDVVDKLEIGDRFNLEILP